MKKMILVGLFLYPALCFGATQNLCANSAGKITLRTKCKKTETTVTLDSLKGADGATGADGKFKLDGCIKRVGSSISGGGLSSVQVNCESNEFLLNFGYGADDFVSAFAASPIYGTDDVPTGALVATTGGGSHTLSVLAYCCPR